MIPVATVARGSSSVPTRESTLNAIMNHSNVSGEVQLTIWRWHQRDLQSVKYGEEGERFLLDCLGNKSQLRQLWLFAIEEV